MTLPHFLSPFALLQPSGTGTDILLGELLPTFALLESLQKQPYF